MPHIERAQSRGAMPSAPDAEYEEVRQSFLVRLHGEQVQLTVLAGALGSAEMDAESAFIALAVYAHRLRGAAAVFEFPELRDAAKSLELAANAAVIQRASNREPLVQQAMQTLESLLAFLNGDTLVSHGS